MDPPALLEDRFAVERLAGRGGMGKVYRALDRLTGQPVAIKVHELGEPERFEREVEVLSGLAHPAIVRFVAHGRTPAGQPFLAVEWLDGEDLGARLRREGLSLAEALALAKRVAEGLAAAHWQGVVHRDIKPGNLWLVGGRAGDAKILDFGIARRRGADDLTLTRAGAMIGTPGYMAPEQARGEAVIDARADLFSLGAVLFKCLTGRLPFEAEEVTAVLLKLVLEEPPRLRELCPEAPEALDVLLSRLLAKRAADRPAGAAEVAGALAGILAGEGPGAVRLSQRAPAITSTERSLMCVVVARSPGPPGDGQEALGAALRARGGELLVLADGALLVTVPGGGAFTDQAARAARAALQISARHPEAAVAVVAGRGLGAAHRSSGGLPPGPRPIGEVIDRGVALLHRAGPGVIRIDEVIAGLTAGAFALGGDEVGLLLHGERAREAPRTLLGKPTPFVGRERELLTLEAIVAEVAAESVARAVIVTAPPGVGKSRLRLELVRRLRAGDAEARGDAAGARAVTGLSDPPPRPAAGSYEVWLGRADPMRAGSPFGLIAPVLRHIAGVLDGEPAEVRRRKLAARVARSVPAEDRPRIVAFLGELAGVPFPDAESVALRAARQDAVLMGDQMRRAFEDFLAAECAEGPVLLVLDDVQWGDRPSLQFLDAALRNLESLPFLVIALARPELHTTFPALWAGRPVTSLKLSALTRRTSEALVRGVLGAAAPAATVNRIVSLAGGDAFYLEELVRAVAEGRGVELPETVLAMVEQRLDGLDPRQRRVLRAASVFGGVFWAGGVAALLGGDERAAEVAGVIMELADRELCDRRPTAGFPGHEEYGFRQTLVREAAYAMLPESDRRLGHRLAGAWLARAGESDPGAIAEHFERAGEPERALAFYQRAAAQALDGNDLERALGWAGRALRGRAEAEPEGDDPALPVLGALHLIRAEALRWSDDLAAAAAAAAAALRLLPRGGGAWFLAAGHRATLAARLGLDGELDAVAADIERLWPGPEGGAPTPELVLAAARAASALTLAGAYPRGDRLLAHIAAAEPGIAEPGVLARIDLAMAVRAMVTGDLAVHLIRTAAAAAHFSAAGDARNAALSRATLAFAETAVGRHAAAVDELHEVLGTAERLGLPSVTAYAKHLLGHALARQGSLEQALAVETEAIAAFTAVGDRRLEGGARGYLAQILAEQGDFAAAEREATLALQAVASVPPVRAFTLATRASIRLRRGDPPGALADAEAAHALLLSLGGIEEGEALVRLCRAEALDAAGRRAEAAAAIGEARRRLLERADQIGDPATREGFLGAAPENARTLALASAWGASMGA